MGNLYSIKVINRNNTGDSNCDPTVFYNLGKEPTRIDINRCNTVFRKGDTVIFGGGGLIDYSPKWNAVIDRACNSPAKVVVWGAGENHHFNSKPIQSPNFNLDKHLIGVRHTSLETRLPCPSCKHPLFDKYIGAEGVYDEPLFLAHAGRPSANYDNYIDNADDFEKIIDKVAQHKYIISETYHGAYWSTLLGKPTVIYRPFSTRHVSLELPLANTIEEAVKLLPTVDTSKYISLKEARQRNDVFYQKVLNYIRE